MKHLFEFNIFDKLKEDPQQTFNEQLIQLGWRYMTDNDKIGYAGVCSEFPLIYSGKIGDAIYEYEGCNTMKGEPVLTYMIYSTADFSIDEVGEKANQLAIKIVEFDKKLEANFPKNVMQKIKDMKELWKYEIDEVNQILKNILEQI